MNSKATRSMAREPLYLKAEKELLNRITSGRWPVGTRLGNEFELAEKFGVSQGTMRRALISVEAMGYLSRKPGRGTIVADPGPTEAPAATPPGTQPAAFRRLSLPDGELLPLDVFRARLTDRGPRQADASVFDGPLHILTRTLKSGGERIALEEIALPRSLVPDMDEDQPADFIDLLLALDLVPARLDDHLYADMTDMGTSVALACDRHTALLCLTRLARDSDGKALARQSLRLAGPVGYKVTLGG